MFTGIVREIGTVESVERDGAGARIRVSASLAAELGQATRCPSAGRASPWHRGQMSASRPTS